jgi:uncharacterized protein (TIGR03067 family)
LADAGVLHHDDVGKFAQEVMLHKGFTMRIATLLLILPLGLLTSPQDDTAKDLAKLQGTWNRVSAEVNGKKVAAEELKGVTLTVKGDGYTLKQGDQTRTGTVKIDATKKPKQIDIISAEGPNKGKSLLGIYEVDGDTLRYCIAQPGKTRPTEFAGKEGQSLFVNQRAK